MAEYINRDTALAFPFANGKYDHEHANEHFVFGCESYKEWLEQLPTADVVPVVRCGECKWSKNYGLDLMCQKHSGITKNKLGEDIHFVEWHSKYYFCSDGERRDAK